MSYPERIVCLAAEVPEIFFQLGALDKVVGISAYTTRPAEAMQIPKVSGFKFGNMKRVLSFKPDVVILTSDVQKDLAAELVSTGVTIVHFNPHRLDELFKNITLLGNLVNESEKAEQLNVRLHKELNDIQTIVQDNPNSPRVYFEEWMDPLICGTGWVSDLITAAGGQDIFREKSIEGRKAAERVVTNDEVLQADPDIIFASWCGKPFDRSEFESRPGYKTLPAVQNGRVYELNSEILQFGPMLFDRLHELSKIIQTVAGSDVNWG
ncbi:cobalamin-binding protein [Alicyclobacillus sp. SO9]|uniref:cobalamin-binding protein n=1 Tax=Alicyclobacillus sp. SO9 TaxID=2665646 RepID=UPI0018E6F30B|nr:cobalamin-binding protein [Alicyclobacillus sp. SO9]QQE79681.1 cobalamin-binding protein [Alicyclobacillus sp. SO9]